MKLYTSACLELVRNVRGCEVKSSAEDDPNAAWRSIAIHTPEGGIRQEELPTCSDHHPLPMSHTQSRTAPQKMPPKRQSTSKLPKAFCSGPCIHNHVNTTWIRYIWKKTDSDSPMVSSEHLCTNLVPFGCLGEDAHCEVPVAQTQKWR